MKSALNNIRRARPLLGTFVEISASASNAGSVSPAVEAAFAAIDRVHRLMSFHEAGSDVSRLNCDAGRKPAPVDDWTLRVIETAHELNLKTKGAFDITIAPVLQGRGLLPRLPHDSPNEPARRGLAGAIELLPGNRVRFGCQSLRVDLGGIAKGFAVDLAINVLRDYGMESGLVNAGGDLAAFGAAPHSVLLRHPGEPTRLLCCVDIHNEALASSGQLFDPVSGRRTKGSAIVEPVSGGLGSAVAGATVRASSCMIADALTKVVMIEGRRSSAILRHYGASALMVTRHYEVEVTSDWRGTVQLAA